MPGSKRAKHSRPAGTKRMARKNTIRDARLASQAYAATLRRLTTAQALHSPDTLELSAAEFIARNYHQRAMRELSLWETINVYHH